MMRFMVFALLPAGFSTGVCPDLALASGGISEFTGPLEKVVNTLTGPAGKFISIAAFGITFIIYLFNREDISGSFKLLLQVVMGISGLAFAGSIVNSVFSFSGAVIPTAAPVPVPPGAAALEALAMQTEPAAAASMPQAIPVPAQTVLPTTTQTSPKLSLEKPNPGEMTHYVPSAPLPAPVPAVAEEVSAEPPAVIETVSVSAEPVSLPSWQVERGRMLREQMENWAAQAPYTLIWSAQNDYEMQSSATFSGVFIEAVKNLFAALASNGVALRVTIYQGNNVMEVSEH